MGPQDAAAGMRQAATAWLVLIILIGGVSMRQATGTQTPQSCIA